MVDQGQRGTCLAIAITTSHGRERKADFSAEYLHWSSGKYHSGRGDPRAAGAALQRDGQPPEHQWPYDANLNDADPSYVPRATLKGPFQFGRTDRILSSVDDMVLEIDGGGWPVIALRVTDRFQRAEGGLVLPGGRGSAGHAVLAVGVATVLGAAGELKQDDRLICIRNSWGDRWGVNGHALITEQALNECMIFATALDSA
nr:C1 family peptidase [Rhodococcus erythropolis]